MVFVSQQYDQYQQIANKMTQYRNQQQSEKLVTNFPRPKHSNQYGCFRVGRWLLDHIQLL